MLGVVLVLPALSAMPAQAAGAERAGLDLIDLPIIDLPVIGPFTGTVAPLTAGAGSITSTTAGLLCDNSLATSVVPQGCSDNLSSLDLNAVLGLTQVLLTAQPASGWTFDKWVGCPTSPVENLCTVPGTLLGGLTGSTVSPTAEFDPICDQLPAPIPGVCDSADPTAPKVEITSGPDAQTSQTTAEFGFKATNADGSTSTDVTFECRLATATEAGIFETCASPKKYSALKQEKYTFTVRAFRTAKPDVKSNEATRTWTVGAATEAPQTSLAEKPGRWLLSRSTTVSLFASDAQSYTCSLDGRAVGCDGGFAVLRKLSSRTHTFAGAAENAAGVDTTPARAVFTVPVNNTSLKHAKGFAKKRGSGHFLNTYSLAKRKGATLTRPAKNIKRVSLVVTKGKGYGTVKVFLNKLLLKKVSLASSRTHGKRIVDVAAFGKRKAGTIRIVTTSKKPVVIEGLGIASR